MIGAIGGVNGIRGVSPYQNISKFNLQRMEKAYAAQQNTQAAQVEQSAETGRQWKLTGESSMPVQPVRAIGAPASYSAEAMDPAQKMEQGADPVEMAVRMRIQQPEAEEAMPANAAGQQEEASYNPVGQKEEESVMKLPGQKDEPTTPIEKELAEQAEKAEKAKEARKAEQAEEMKESKETEESEETKSAQEVMEDEECQTCENRKYQDGSNDPGVSFKTPTNIKPEAAAAAVRGHEMEHVMRNRASAAREGKEVVSQSVTLQTGICPECGDVYVSGGTTRTTTAQKAEPVQQDAAEWVKRANHFSIVV